LRWLSRPMPLWQKGDPAVDLEREKVLSAQLMDLRGRGIRDVTFAPKSAMFFTPMHGYWYTNAEGELLETDNCHQRISLIGSRLKALCWRVTSFGAVIVRDYTGVPDATHANIR